MTRETKIALLVGLVFIICFGVILGNSRSPMPSARSTLSVDQNEPLSARPVVPSVAPVGGPFAPVQGAGTIGRTVEPSAQLRVVRPATVEAVNAVATQPAAPPPAPAAQLHRVIAGETLWKIARKVYGQGNEQYYKLILEANRGKLAGPQSLQVGQELVIPPLPAGATRVVDGQSLREYLVRLPPGQTVRPDGRALVPVSRQAPAPSPTTVTPGPARAPAAPGDAAGRPARGRAYKVRPGESLAAIARAQMKDGSSAAINKLFEANRDKLASRDRVAVGTVLTIPN